MKKKLTVLTALLLCLAMALLSACSAGNSAAGENKDDEPKVTMPEDTEPKDTEPKDTDPVPADPTIVGSWISPDPINAEYDELWVFEPDVQTYHLYQVDKDYKVNKSIDGTYKLGENNILEVTLMGYTLTYTYALSDANTLVLSDHGTDATYVRYTGEIKR